MGSVLVTGATGFLGGHLVERLAGHGTDVVALGRDRKQCDRLAAKGHRVIRCDLADPADFPSLHKLDAVVHCAALSAPFGRLGDFVRANVTATQNVVDLAVRQGVGRFVLISTPSVYFDWRDRLQVPETIALPPPVNHYARTKRAAEEIVLADLEQRAIVLRPRGIFGSGDTALLPRLLQAAQKRPLPLLRNGAARIDLTHVDDVVDAIMAALAADASACGEIYNVSSGEVLPVRMIADEACARAGITARWRPVSLSAAMAVAGVVEHLTLLLPGDREPMVTRYGLGLFAYAQSLDITKAAHRLDWRPKVSFAEGLDRTFSQGAR